MQSHSEKQIIKFKKYVGISESGKFDDALTKFKELVDSNPSLLAVQNFTLPANSEIPWYKEILTSLTLGEYALLFASNDEMLKYVVSKLSDETLKNFLTKKFICKNDEKNEVKATGFHLLAVTCKNTVLHLEILARLKKQGIDTYLQQKDSENRDVIYVSYLYNGNASISFEYLKAAEDKAFFICNKQYDYYTLFHQLVLIRRNSFSDTTVSDIQWCLTEAGDKIADVIRIKCLKDLTPLHASLLDLKYLKRKDLSDGDIALILAAFKKYYSYESLIKTIFHLYWLSDENKPYKTPYQLATKVSRTNITELFLECVDYENIDKLNAVISLIENDLSSSESFHNKVSLKGLFNLLYLNTLTDYKAMLAELILKRISENKQALSIEFLLELGSSFIKYKTNVQALVSKEEFISLLHEVPNGELLLAKLVTNNIVQATHSENSLYISKLVVGYLHEVSSTNTTLTKLNKEREPLLKTLATINTDKAYKKMVEITLQLNDHTKPTTDPFKEIETLNISNNIHYPEFFYLAATCYRLGFLVEKDYHKALFNYRKLCNDFTYHCKNPRNKFFLNHFESIILEIASQLKKDLLVSDQKLIKCDIAQLLCLLSTIDKNYDLSRAYLVVIEANKGIENNQYNFFLGEQYYLLASKEKDYQKDDLEKAITYKYGPALAHQASVLSKSGQYSSNKLQAVQNYYHAITTPHQPQVKTSIDALIALMGKDPTEAILDIAVNLIHKTEDKDFLKYIAKFKKRDFRIRWLLDKNKALKKEDVSQYVLTLLNGLSLGISNFKVEPPFTIADLKKAAEKEIIFILNDTPYQDCKFDGDKINYIKLETAMAIHQFENPIQADKKTKNPYDQINSAIAKNKEETRKFLVHITEKCAQTQSNFKNAKALLEYLDDLQTEQQVLPETPLAPVAPPLSPSLPSPTAPSLTEVSSTELIYPDLSVVENLLPTPEFALENLPSDATNSAESQNSMLTPSAPLDEPNQEMSLLQALQQQLTQMQTQMQMQQIQTQLELTNLRENLAREQQENSVLKNEISNLRNLTMSNPETVTPPPTESRRTNSVTCQTRRMQSLETSFTSCFQNLFNHIQHRNQQNSRNPSSTVRNSANRLTRTNNDDKYTR